MNCIPGTASRAALPALRRIPLAVLLVASSACSVTAAEARESEGPVYRLEYTVTPEPGKKGAKVEMKLEQDADLLREVDMSTRGDRLKDFSGDGEIRQDNGRVVWLPPREGGTLTWFASLDHRRAKNSYDAYIEDDWALFRGEDLIPPARTRTEDDALSDTTLEFDLPKRWSSATVYAGEKHKYQIVNPERRFDTPTGWMVLGRIGSRNERIEGVEVKVAGPIGQGVRRMDILALLHWTLPDLLRVIPEFPERLVIVSAGKPMWRGALSGPASLYVHADRPLLSENATSTFVHELVHVGLGISAKDGADWIVEGIAELYSLEILRRSGTISEERFRAAHLELAEWGREAETLCKKRSSGSVTARAVTLLAETDSEIRKVSRGRKSMDDVMRRLAEVDEKITVDGFRQVAEEVAGGPLATLEADKLPGCD